MKARIACWLPFLLVCVACYGLIRINDALARQNIALQAALSGPHDSKVLVWATKDGHVYVVVDERYGHMYPLMCAKLGFRTL